MPRCRSPVCPKDHGVSDGGILYFGMGPRPRGDDMHRYQAPPDKAASTCPLSALIKAVSSGGTPSGAVSVRSA